MKTSSPPSEERLLTRKEAARLIGKAPQTLAVWKCNGRYALPYVVIGRSCMYRLSDLLAWIDSHARASQTRRASQSAAFLSKANLELERR
jgi:hypothetical protein